MYAWLKESGHFIRPEVTQKASKVASAVGDAVKGIDMVTRTPSYCSFCGLDEIVHPLVSQPGTDVGARQCSVPDWAKQILMVNVHSLLPAGVSAVQSTTPATSLLSSGSIDQRDLLQIVEPSLTRAVQETV